MHSNDMISVIVPFYNAEKYAKECIDSIINQTYRNLEIILVNDGSPDLCKEIIEKYARSDVRIKTVHKENGGLSDARNAGLNVATGNYVGFVDADDVISVKMYEILHKVSGDRNADIVICAHKSTKSFVTEYTGVIEYSNFSAITELARGVRFASHACDKLYKIELFSNIRYPYGKYYEDQFTTYKLFYKSKKIAFINSVLYYYRPNAIGIVQGQYTLKDHDVIQGAQELLEFMKENKILGTNFQKQSLVRVTLSIFRKIAVSELYDADKAKIMQQIVQKHLGVYLVSRYKISGKMMALILAVSVKVTKKILNWMVNKC